MKRTGRFNKRSTASVILVILLCAVMISPMEVRARTIVEFWSPWSGIWQTMLEEIIDEFNASQSEIEAKYVFVNPAVYSELVLLAPNPPGVVAVWGFGATEFAAQGVLAPLDAWIERDLDRSEFYPAALEQYVWNGQTWGAAFGVAANALIYNKQLFAEAGLAGPESTLEHVAEQATRLLRMAPDGRVTQIGLHPLNQWGSALNFSYMFGGSFYDPELDELTFQDATNLAAVEWAEDYYNRHGGFGAVGQFYGSYGGNDPFMVGAEAMRLSHSWYLTELRQHAPDVDWGVASLPLPAAGDGHKGPLLGSDALAMHRHAPDQEAAWVFLKWMMTHGQQRWAEIQGIHSGWIGGQARWEEWIPGSVHEIFTQSISLAKPAPSIPGADYITMYLYLHLQEFLTHPTSSSPMQVLERSGSDFSSWLQDIVGPTQ